MEDFFKRLYFSTKYLEEHVLQNNIDYRKAFREIRINKNILKRGFTKKQELLLETILQEKDYIKNIVAEASFKEGFKQGFKIGVSQKN